MANDPLLSNKIFGAILLAGIIATGSGFITKLLFTQHEVDVASYPIEIEERGNSIKESEEIEVDPTNWLKIESLLNVAINNVSTDVMARGQKLFKACASCHNITDGAPNKVGPNLWAILNRSIASNPGYVYSNSLKEKSDLTWSYEQLNAFLTNPKKYADKTKMSYKGIPRIADRSAILYYLGQQK